MIQEILNSSSGICYIPSGVYNILEGTKINIPFNVTGIYGYGVTINVINATGNISTVVPLQSLFDCNQRPDWTRLDIRGLTINGPDTSGWDSYTEAQGSAINWNFYKTWNSILTLEDVKITGGYSYAVHKSGGGRLDLINCELGGWVGGYAHFESHGGYGSSNVRRTKLLAPENSKYSSIGAYIHPHLDVLWDNVYADNWNRYACYLNGTPQSAGNHDLLEVIANNCSLIQTGSSSETTLIRCIEQGTPKNGGSYFKGPVLSIGSRWASTKGMIGFLSGINADRRFIRDTFATAGLAMAAGSNTTGRILFNNCNFELSGKSTVLKLTNLSTTAVKIVSSSYTGSSTGFVINIEGGSLQYVDSQVLPNTRVIAPGILL